MRKFTRLVCAAVLILALVLVSACGEGLSTDPSHPFAGTFSEESYESEQDAVKALQGELSGKAYSVKFVKYSHEAKISRSTFSELNEENLEEGEKVVSGKKILVTYSKGDQTDSEEESDKTFSSVVFQTKLGDETRYRYYVERASYDGMVTKSYFDFLNTLNGMRNFTYQINSDISVAASGSTQSASTSETIQMDGDKALIHLEQGDENLWCYLEKEGTETKFWVSTNGEDYSSDFEDLESFGIDPNEIFEKNPTSEEFGEEIDHTYFECTESGLKLNEEYKETVLKKLMGDSMESLGSLANMVDLDGSLSCNIVIGDWGMQKILMNADIAATIFGQIFMESISVLGEISEVGTTVVEKPF